MNIFEPYFYYIIIFFGLIFVLGILIFIAYKANKKK